MTGMRSRLARLHRLFISSLFVLLTSASVEAQSGFTRSVVTPSNVTPSDVTPSDGLSSWPMAEQAQPGLVSAVKRTGTKKSMNAGAETQQATQLCFLPGIGWQSVVVPSVGEADTQRLAVSSAYARRAGAEQANDGCSGLSANSPPSELSRGSQEQPAASIDLKALTTKINDVAKYGITAEKQATYQRGLLGMNSMSPASAGKSTSTIGSQRGIQVLSSMPTARGSTFGLDASGIRSKAYSSTFELRRMMWNAPDLETRFKLQRLLDSSGRARRRPSPYSSEALDSTLDRSSFRSNTETSKRAHRETLGARPSRSTRRPMEGLNSHGLRGTALGSKRTTEN
jgi:hypothetical protein